jgi:hypothetical protein
MRTERETLPPTPADESAAEFEMRIREQGEERARWDRLMALLESNAESEQAA